MHEDLRQAVHHFLDTTFTEEAVDDLILVEVEWPGYEPPLMEKAEAIRFQGQDWPVVYTNSELIARRTLCEAANGRIVLLMPHHDSFPLPADFQARAYQGTVYPLGISYLLYARTERNWPTEVNYQEWEETVRQRFEALVREAGRSSMKWGLNRDDLERLLVKIAFGLEVNSKEAPVLLSDLVAAQRSAGDSPTDLEMSLLEGQLREVDAEHATILAWAATEPGRAEQIVRTGIMLAAERAAGYSPNWGNLGSLRAQLIGRGRRSDAEAMDLVVELATSALEHLHHETRKRIVREAEQSLIEVLPEDAFNQWFPQMLERETLRVARELASGDPAGPEKVATLRQHLFASSFDERLKALEVMAALATGWRKQREEISDTTESWSVSDWARWYAREGGWLDLAALKLTQYQQRGADIAEQIEQLLEAYWRWRQSCNEAFARTYLENYEAALHDREEGVFGTHRILEWVVRPQRQEDKRVLLVVVDGMSYPHFCHLLQQWQEHSRPVYARESFIALSLLPSITSVSRKALFLNQLPSDPLDDESTYQEKASLSEEKALAAAFSRDSVKYYYKGNLGTGQDLRNDLEFSVHQIITVIYNTIDDDLSSTTTTVRLHQLEEMGSLARVVETALERGWTVVITADHGHTWYRSDELKLGLIRTNAAPRYLPVSGTEQVTFDAVVTKDSHILRLQAGEAGSPEALAFLTATGSFFGRHSRRGFHGGASLEEVVVPCAILTFDAPTRGAVIRDSASIAERPGPVESSPEQRGVLLKLRDGRVIDLELPFTADTREARILQALAWHGEASEAELKKAVGTRRVSGLLAALRDRLAAAGPEYEYIEHVGTGASGASYRFRTELLPSD